MDFDRFYNNPFGLYNLFWGLLKNFIFCYYDLYPAIKHTRMKANIGISDKNTLDVSKLLNVILADEVLLYSKTRNYHWNVTGREFGQLHKFFEEQYNDIAELADSVAERTRKLGHFAVGTLADFLKLTHLTEGQEIPDAGAMIQNLLDDHETIIRSVRNNIETVGSKYKDQGTADFLTSLLEAHEKMAWMLRAHLDNLG